MSCKLHKMELQQPQWQKLYLFSLLAKEDMCAWDEQGHFVMLMLERGKEGDRYILFLIFIRWLTLFSKYSLCMSEKQTKSSALGCANL